MNSDGVLAKIWEDAPEKGEWRYSLYNDDKDSPTELYILSPDGHCWKIVAQEHPHI